MKKALRITAWILGFVVLLLGSAAAWVYYAPTPKYDPPAIPDLKVEVTPERVAQGAKLASTQCMMCHMGEDGKLSGKYMEDVPKDFGKIASMNITKHPERGIGKWTDGELYAFLRTGLRKDGSFNVFMPNYPNMADEDVFSIIAWLHSDDPRLAPSERLQQPTKFSLLSKGLIKFVIRPAKMPKQAIPLPDTTNPVAWGRYLADGAYDCYSCHSASFTTLNSLEPEKSVGFYGGGNEILNLEGEVVLTKNITPDKASGIGNWTEEQFVNTLKTLRRPDGTMLSYPMLPYGMLTEGERKAIYAYLRTVPPIQNAVQAKKN